MANIERTAYPRFPRTLTLKDLQAWFTQRPEETECAKGFALTPDRRLAIINITVKKLVRFGYEYPVFLTLDDIAEQVHAAEAELHEMSRWSN